MNPISYLKAIKDIGLLIKRTGITPDIINVGGGFPTTYPDLYPQPLKHYIKEINKGIGKLNLNKKVELICEPGRALVAESGSTIVKVELRKNKVYILMMERMDLYLMQGNLNLFFHQKLFNLIKNFTKRIIPYSFFGPTCDGLDYMKGPFNLPSNIKQGDYIEIGQLGAYGISMRTKFNGFYSSDIYEVEDNPIMSIYNADENNNIKTLFA